LALLKDWMGILDRYLIKQIFAATLFAVIILCSMFLLGNIFKEARPLLVGKNPSILLIVKFVVSVLPLALMYMLPCSFLAAILITIGRFSSGNELTAIRMTGRGLMRISRPIFLLAILFCGLCYWLNTSAAPSAKFRQRQIIFDAIQTDPNKFLSPGVVRHHLKDQVVFVERREGDYIYGLHIFTSEPEEGASNAHSYIYAQKAWLFVDESNLELRLRLFNATLSKHYGTSKPPDFLFVEMKEPLLFDLRPLNKNRFKVSSMTNSEIQELLASTDPQDLAEMTEERRNTMINENLGRSLFSLSCLAFAFVGIPLAVTTKRKETSSGILISILIAVLYFSFFLVANDMRDKSGPLVPIMFLMPNVLAIVVGLFLFKRVQT
jgi:lipopolysaccharide export LptBFGC system permease protein LptF